jgi:hypothetical protein
MCASMPGNLVRSGPLTENSRIREFIPIFFRHQGDACSLLSGYLARIKQKAVELIYAIPKML